MTKNEAKHLVFYFAFLHASTSILRGFYDKDSLIAFIRCYS